MARNWCTQRYVLFKNKSRLSEGRTLSKPAHDPIKVNLSAAIGRHGFLAYHLDDDRMTGEFYHTVLETDVLPAIQAEYGADTVTHIAQDNAPFHTTRVATDIFDTDDWKKVKVIKLPPYSLDLNIIENAWGHLKRAVSEEKPMNRAELLAAIPRAIDRINAEEHTTHYFRNLFASYNARCEAVIEEDGFPTKY